MSTEVTTEGLQEKFASIIDTFSKKIDEALEPHKKGDCKILIIAKIANNLKAASLLWTHGATNEARMILRGAAESLVLFIYLAEFPNEVDRYKKDAKILDFKNHYAFVKRDYGTYETLAKHFSELPEDFQESFLTGKEQSLVSLTADQLDKILLSKYKPLSQRVHFMLDKIEKAGALEKSKLYQYSVIVFNMNSDIIHNSFRSVIEGHRLAYDTELVLSEIKECLRQSLLIIHELTQFIKKHYSIDLEATWISNIIHMYEYLGYKTPNSHQSPQKISDFIYIPTFEESLQVLSANPV